MQHVANNAFMLMEITMIKEEFSYILFSSFPIVLKIDNFICNEHTIFYYARVKYLIYIWPMATVKIMQEIPENMSPFIMAYVLLEINETI